MKTVGNCRYLKQNGTVYLQKQLYRERPTYRAEKVACKQKLTQLVCRAGVVWGLTEAHSLLVRTGITADTQEGTDWHPLDGYVQS